MRTMRETEVPVVLPGDVEFIGASEPFRIAVGSSDHGCEEVARLDTVTAYVHGHLCTTPCRLNGAVEAQELLHRALDQRRLFAQTLELPRIVQQRQQAVANQACGGLVPGKQKQHAHADELIVIQDAAVLLGGDERAQ